MATGVNWYKGNSAFALPDRPRRMGPRVRGDDT